MKIKYLKLNYEKLLIDVRSPDSLIVCYELILKKFKILVYISIG